MLSKIGIGELILVLVIALVIFGPSRLPELGEAMGKTISGFRAHADKKFDEGKDEEVEDEVDEE